MEGEGREACHWDSDEVQLGLQGGEGWGGLYLRGLGGFQEGSFHLQQRCHQHRLHLALAALEGRAERGVGDLVQVPHGVRAADALKEACKHVVLVVKSKACVMGWRQR